MRIAGKKNDGAWFRANRNIASLDTEEEKNNLAGSIAAIVDVLQPDGESKGGIAAAFSALSELQARAGLVLTGIPTTEAEWARNMVDRGIPRQIWMGRLTWTSTTKTGTGAGAEYAADHQSEMHYFAKELRRVVYQYFLVRRQMRDLFDIGAQSQGNVGGHPDAQDDGPGV